MFNNFMARITRKVSLLVASVLFVLGAGWFVANPARQFGFSIFGFTIFNRIPYPLADIEVRPDGQIRRVSKTHDLRAQALDWLLASKPDVLIISLGWNSVVEPEQAVWKLTGPDLHIVPNKTALSLFNRFIKAGRRVAIHYHSTC